MEKLTIYHDDGTKTEVEPLQMWQPYLICTYPPHDCNEPAAWLYKNFKADKPIPVCGQHARKIREGKTGVLLRLCLGDKSMLDESLTNHKYHCPKCDVHLTSVGLCSNCGTRFEIESRRTSGVADVGETAQPDGDSSPAPTPLT